MLQEIHKTGWLVWTFTQDAFAKSYILSYDLSSLMFSNGNITEYGGITDGLIQRKLQQF